MNKIQGRNDTVQFPLSLFYNQVDFCSSEMEETGFFHQKELILRSFQSI